MSKAAIAAAQERLWNVPGNDRCVDCGSKKPDWASINLGILMCLECSGIHRHLGVHISKVRSLKLDVECWQGELLEYMCSIGNKAFNHTWESHLPNYVLRPAEYQNIPSLRERFIELKYRDRIFIGGGPDKAWTPDILELSRQQKMNEESKLEEDEYIIPDRGSAGSGGVRDGRASIVPNGTILKSGFLSKLGGSKFFRRWQKRWCIIRDNSLIYYKDPSSDEPQGSINLTIVTTEIEDPETNNKPHLFSITTDENDETHNGRKFLFSAESPLEMLNWVEIVRRISTHYQGRRIGDRRSLTMSSRSLETPNNNEHIELSPLERRIETSKNNINDIISNHIMRVECQCVFRPNKRQFIPIVITLTDTNIIIQIKDNQVNNDQNNVIIEIIPTRYAGINKVVAWRNESDPFLLELWSPVGYVCIGYNSKDEKHNWEEAITQQIKSAIDNAESKI